MAKFQAKNGSLFIDGRKVLRAWESYTGWYWFAVEKVREQVSFIDGRPVKDTIWSGFVQGYMDEWGEFSHAQLAFLHPKVWEISRRDIPHSGREEGSVPLRKDLCERDRPERLALEELIQIYNECAKNVKLRACLQEVFHAAGLKTCYKCKRVGPWSQDVLCEECRVRLLERKFRITCDTYTDYSCNACGRGTSEKEIQDYDTFMVLHESDTLQCGDVKCDRCGSLDIYVKGVGNLKEAKA